MKKEPSLAESDQPEAATLNGPAAYEEELQDYSRDGREADKNNPITHPEPTPATTGTD